MPKNPLKDNSGPAYYIGYDQKDVGKVHSLNFKLGISDEDNSKAVALYRAEAMKTSVGGDKARKNPFSDKKELEFTVGNLHRLATWFVHQHKLQAVARILTLPLIISYAISKRDGAGCYRLDEAQVCGKYGGGVLTVNSSEALLQLNLLNGDAPLPVLVGLVQTVLYGKSMPLSTTAVYDGAPSTYDAAQSFTLTSLKAAAAAVEASCSCTSSTTPTTKSGKYKFVDLGGSPISEQAAINVEARGLTGESLFATNQRKDACGYIAYNAAVEMRRLGRAFSTSSPWTRSRPSTPHSGSPTPTRSSCGRPNQPLRGVLCAHPQRPDRARHCPHDDRQHRARLHPVRGHEHAHTRHSLVPGRMVHQPGGRAGVRGSRHVDARATEPPPSR